MINLKKIPLNYIFILLLIISSNYIGELFPCYIQKILTDNVFSKHIICFITLFLFVVLTDSDDKKNVKKNIFISITVYILFLLLINNNKTFFMFLLFLLSIIYVIQIIKTEYNIDDENNENDDNNENKNINKILKYIIQLELILYIIFFIILIVGVIIYLGKKKIEYKDNFSYILFLFEKHRCKHNTPSDIGYLQAFKAAFNM